MVNLICGPKGSGKTQKLIEHAAEELRNTDGLIVFIDANDRNRINITSEIRFINAKEFMIDNADKFFGFLCGIVSENYDINRIYIDNAKDMLNTEDESEFNHLFHKLNETEDLKDVEFYFTMNTTAINPTEWKGCEYQSV